MTEKKRRKPYVRPSMEVIEVETTSILAGSTYPNEGSTLSNEWGDGGSEELDWD